MTPERDGVPVAFEMPVRAARVERPIGELFSDLASETTQLVRQEIDLVTGEVGHKARYAGKHASLLAAGGLLGVVGLLALTAALVLALGSVMALWLAALLVGVAIVAIAWAVVEKGISGLRRLDPKPEHTIASLRDNKSWAQRQIR